MSTEINYRQIRRLNQFLATVVMTLSLSLSGVAFGQQIPSLAPMLEKVTPAVVNISTSRKTTDQMYFLNERDLRRFFQNGPGSLPERPQTPVRATGSGVIVDAENGYVITNHHVVANADAISVALKDGRQFEASLVGSDARTDIAMLKIEATDLVEIPIADMGNLRVGDYVVAIGNPFGIGQTVTSGIVSALGRAGLNNENYEDFIQTDAAINVGNSGGALVDLQGRLLGINTAIISGSGTSSGVGFAVPADMVHAVMDHLLRDGYVRRGQLGVQIRDHTPAMEAALAAGTETGALVMAVVPDSAAEAAGIEASDVIVAVDGKAISSSRELRNIIGLARVDRPLELTLFHGGQRREISLQLDSVPGQIADNGQRAPEDGSRSFDRDFQGALLQSTNSADGKGVEVTEVRQQSPAWRSGLLPGDIIYELNRQPVSDLDSFNEILAETEGMKALSVIRDKRKMLIVVG
ncbi:MAG: Do family serine endopeptidase [Pseudomonadales bacterium]|nr:Do family serine endopeptidase [Pseudomonadales bacterium]